jgi:hypothetical protein
MKKIIIFLLFVSIYGNSQELVLYSTQGSLRIKENGVWNDWSDWVPMQNTINIYNDRITFVIGSQNSNPSTYLIAGKKDFLDKNGNITISFDCLDEKGSICNIKIAEVNGNNINLHVNVEYPDVMTKYITSESLSTTSFSSMQVGNWVKVTLSNNRFSIYFPSNPKYINRIVNEGTSNAILQHFYTFPNDNTVPWYALTYFEIPTNVKFDLTQHKDPLINGFISTCQGKISGGFYNKYQGIETYDFNLYSGASQCFGTGRILSVNNHVFILLYLYDTINLKDKDTFFNKFEF